MTPLPRRTRRRAAALRIVCLVAMALVVLATLVATLRMPDLLADRLAHFQMPHLPEDVGSFARALIGAGVWIGAGAALFTLWQMARLFACYAADAALTPEATEAVRAIGAGLFGLAVFGVLGRTGTGLALSIDAPDGAGVLAIGITGSDIGFALAGALMLLIGSVLSQAMEAARENAGFV